jgi:tRNA-specific 2-thiouridylase
MIGQKVYVGLSGGVDSSVSAKLLKDQGFDVTGVYMKNWSKAIGGHDCPWEEDYQDAKKLASFLDIDFEMFDFETEYFDKVVGYMLEAFKQGVTPNPDVMCNQEIKFKLFLDTCIERGADYIATGHYARSDASRLLRAKDENKDQTYFLYRISSGAVSKTLFPIGGLTKPEVRELAQSFGLPTATKKESMGICFVGKVGIKDFLKEYVSDISPGPIVDQNGLTIGEHEGAIFYTIGQRQGLGVGGGLPFYVTGKNMSTNTVYVTSNIADESLWTTRIALTSVHWIHRAPLSSSKIYVRTRHRAPLVEVDGLEQGENNSVELVLKESVKAITPGQSCVIYTDTECLGGGIVC